MTDAGSHENRGQEPFVYGKFRFDDHGLTIIGDGPTIAEAVDCLHELVYRQKRRQLWIGDVDIFSNRAWGKMYIETMAKTGLDYNTLANYRWVASRIDPSRRRPELGFAIHREVAKLPPDEQDQVLGRAAKEGWTREETHREVQRRECEAKRPAGPILLSGLRYGEDRLEVLATLPDKSIDLVLTDPPTDTPEALRHFEDVLSVVVTKLKPSSHAYIFVPDWMRYVAVAPIVERHLQLRNVLHWLADARSDEKCSWVDEYALILFAQHKGRRHLNGEREGNALSFKPVPGHPLEKPQGLLDQVIEKSTQPKEVVLDPFMGTGGVCLAAACLGRHYIGIETDRQRFEQAQRRLATVVG